jgi:glycosyltransferase involved in cell wall biosynthesis
VEKLRLRLTPHMPGPLVSCIVPVFNGARHLKDAIDSILAQTHSPLQVVAVDDGSSDGSAAILEGYGGGVEVVRQVNAGPAAARNTGIRTARGDFVAFLDQDDWWHPEKLARQLARFDAVPRLDFVVTHAESVWEDDTSRGANQPRGGYAPGYITGTLLARRTVFDLIGPFAKDLKYVDALEWFVRAADQQAVSELMSDVLLYHRVHAGNLSRRGAESRAECLRVVKHALDRRRQGRAGAG